MLSSPELQLPEYDDEQLDKMLARAKARSTRRRARRRRMSLTGLSVLVALGLAASAAYLSPELASGSGRHHNLAVPAVPAPKWVLVGDVTSPWREVPGQDLKSGFSVTCPSVTNCYAEGAGELEVTTDGGKTWRRQPEFKDLFELTPVSCISASTCAVLSARVSARPVLGITSDGGQAWTWQTLPAAITANYSPGPKGGLVMLKGASAVTVSCWTAETCVVLTSNLNGPGGAFVTRDGGQTWTTSFLPYRYMAAAVQCFTDGRCISTGSNASGTGMAAYSSNGGSTWKAASVPYYGDTNQFDGGSSIPPWADLSCSSGSSCMAAHAGGYALVATTDGGQSWSKLQVRGLPAGKQLVGLSCPAVSDCWVAGDHLMSFSSGPYTGPGSDVVVFPGTAGFLASSTNGGKSWSSAELPPGVQSVEGVSCPSANTCFAMASKSPGAASFVLLAYRA